MRLPELHQRPRARIVDVTGGSAGLAARYAAVRGLAGGFESAASRLAELTAGDVGTGCDGALLASAPASPATFADAEAALVSAGAGLAAAAALWEADAVLVRTALAALQASDVAARAGVDELDRRLGVVAGIALRATGPALVAAVRELPPEARRRLDRRLQGWVLDHPEVVQHAVNGGGGLLAGLVGAPALTLGGRQATGLLAALYDDGRPVVRRRRDLDPPSEGLPPRSVEDALRHLSDTADLSPDPASPDNGTIEVQTLDPGTDHVRHVVYLPGTDDIATLPWTQDQDVRDLGTDLRSAAGGHTAYQRGILEALRAAGVRPDEPVLLVGHSLGGMEAAALASRDTGFTITDVVTAGSPAAQVDGYPDGVHVLSLERAGDVVPLTDGRDNPDTVAQTTVRFDDGIHDATIVGRHDYDHYVAGAAAVDSSADPSVADEVRRLHDRGFLSGAHHVTSQVFQVTRGGEDG